MAGLRLRVEDFQDPEPWRWLLTDDSGVVLADHQVALDPGEPEYEGFVDLAGFLRDRAVPDQRLQSEAELVDQVGGWIGNQVLGEAVSRAIVDHSPVVVRVELPEDADSLLYRPLELAHVDGLPLAVQDVSLVFEAAGEANFGPPTTRSAASEPRGSPSAPVASSRQPARPRAIAPWTRETS
jgi:hypothetical protein